MRSLLLALLAAASFAVTACGGATVDTSSGGDASTGGQDGGHDGATSTVACAGKTCGPGEVCVQTTSGGGPCLAPDDAGVCPDGTHTTGCCDNTTTSYACKVLPDACKGTLACPCADSLCQCGGCQIADAGLLTCACLYP